MLKSLIAGTAALSLVLATPAMAEKRDQDRLATFLIGAAALAVIGAALGDNGRDEDATPTHHTGQQGWSDLRDRANRWQVLPGACLEHVTTRFGSYPMFGRHCLAQRYRHATSLPASCAVRIFDHHGPRDGYDPQCLRDAGYRADRRR